MRSRYLVLALGGGIVLTTCVPARRESLTPTVVVIPPVVTPPPAASAASLPDVAPSVVAEAPGAPGTLLPGLSRRLQQLTTGERTDHVRIVWIGDSHTAADLWTGAFRRVLQSRFGNGGPGFVHVGWPPATYRHDGVRVALTGRWRLEPRTYAQTQRYADGVLGLGGVRTVATGADGHATVKIVDPALVGTPLKWDIAYARQSADRTAFHFTGPQGPIVRRPTLDGPSPSSPTRIDHLVEPALTADTLTIAPGSVRAAGRRVYFGVVVETQTPGVVVDTLGLNGARLATTLAWDETTWTTELARRRPDAIVVAFGTNESQDHPAHPERYGDQLDALLDRVRFAAPEAECLVRIGHSNHESAPRVFKRAS